MYLLDLRNLQEQVKKVFCFKNCTDLSLLEYMNCSSDPKHFANSRPSASNFKQISLHQFFLMKTN